MKPFNAKQVKEQAVQWIRNWFEENGKGCKAVIGISGGKDSNIVAALCVETLGKRTCYRCNHAQWRTERHLR